MKCNVDMNKFKCHIPHFYVEILKTWFNLNCVKPNTGYEICKQVIWHNRFLMVDNKTVFYKKLYNAGIICINDLLDQDGKFDVYGTLGDEFNNMDYLKLIGIIHSIPDTWKRQITSKIIMEEANKISCIIDDDIVPIEKITSKIVYKCIVQKNKVTPVCRYTLVNKYNINESICKHLFILPWKVTIDNRLRWLQYRITHGILTTNAWLYRIRIINSPICNRCGTSIETLNHLFVECEEVDKFWQEVITFWDILFHGLSVTEKIFGIFESDIENWMLKNQLLLVARRYIYLGRCRESPFSLRAFNNLVKDTMKLEHIIAKQKGKLALHYQKWSIVMQKI